MLDWIAPLACAGCGATHQGRLCPSCLPIAIHRAPVPTDTLAGCWALAGYESGVGNAIRTAKVRGDRLLVRELGRALASRLVDRWPEGSFTAIVPAPSPWTRRLARGFNPAAVLAAELSRATGVPVVHALHVAPGPRQATLNAAARRQSLRGRLRSRQRVTGRVLLVDDVATTGATAEACTRELLGEAASEVWLAVLCRRRDRPTDGSR